VESVLHQTIEKGKTMENTAGQIDILNCGTGHTEIRITEDNPIEMERAKRIIQDMLKRGYALFVHGTDGALIKVKKFDPEHMTYIVADGATVPPEAEPEPIPKTKLRRVKASRVRSTVVGRSAGG
jgi:hypothetical protein